MENQVYFAAQDGDELAGHLSQKFSEWRDKLDESGRERRLAKSYRYYYGQQNLRAYTFSESRIAEAGENGELSVYSTNHYRNLIRSILAITTSQKPAFDARALNTDLSTMNRAKLGNDILDYYMKEKKIFRKSKLTAEMSLVMAQAFLVANWATDQGKAIGVKPVLKPDLEDVPENPEEFTEDMFQVDANGDPMEKIVYEGDIHCTVHSPLDVRVDQGCENWEEVTWADVRHYENKWDLVARYPHQREAILSETSEDHDKTKYMGLRAVDEGSDYVPVYTFYHVPTAGLPNGRLQKRLDNGEVLYDGPYPYGEKFNVFRIAPGEVFGSTEGYTDLYDIIQLQDVVNTLDSSIFTNQKAFGVQAVAVPEGASISPEDTAGMTFVNVPAPMSENMPRAIQLTSTPPELLTNSQRVEKNMEKLSGINSVVRGDPEHNLKSGVALQRVQAMAIQYNSNFQHEWASLLEDVGTFLLHLLKNFANTERMIALSGKRNRGAVVSFKKDDIKDLDSVVVDLGNPLSRTVGGRLEIADRLLEKGLLKTPHQYIQVMETGNLDPMTESLDAELDLIRRENEMFMKGEGIDPMVGDSHLKHIQEHRALIADPYVRANDELLDIVLSHIQIHIQLYKTQDPVWAVVSGEPPAPQPAPPQMMPPGPPGGPEGIQDGPAPGAMDQSPGPMPDPNVIRGK